MKLYYNTVSNDLVTIDASGETWTQGDVDSKTLEVYFGTVAGEVFTVNTGLVLTHECRVVVERPDGAVSPELFLTPQLDGSYKLVISGWIAGVEGNVKITPRLKLGDVVTAYGLAIIAVAEGILPADSVITPEEYNLLLVAINDLAERVTIAEGDIVALETFQAAMIAGTQKLRKIGYDTANPATTFTEIGETRWNDTYKTIETRLSSSTILQHGFETLAYVRNASGTTLVEGTVVYISDETVGGSPHVVVKRATNADDTAYGVLGLVTESIIGINQSGFVTLIGEMTLGGVFTAGQALYLGVNGAVTATKPTAPARVVKLGTMGPSNRAFIQPHIIPSLQMLSDVNIDVTGMTKPVLTKVDDHWVAYDIAPYEANLAQALIDIGVAESDIVSLDGRLDTAESTLTTKADKSTTIVGLNLSANITKSQLLEAVGNATTLAAGFMSATDKSYLDELYALLDTDDADALVNTLGEILQLFNDYPEGADIVTALAGKADVVHTHVEADITDLDKYSQAEADALLLTKVDKVTGKSLIDDTEITRLSGMETGAEVNVIEVVQVGGSPLTVTDKTVNIDLSGKVDKDLSNDTTYPPKATLHNNDTLPINDSEASGAVKKTTIGDIVSKVTIESGAVVPSGEYSSEGLGAYESAVLDVHDVTLETNGDYRCTIKAIETDKLLYVQFPTVTATNALRLSTDNGATYYNVLKNGATLRANIVSGQLVSMYFNGTNFIADIQGDVEIVEEYTDKIESTYGQFNPHDNGVPLVKEVLGRTIPALSNLVVNGDFSGGTTGYATLGAGISVVSDILNYLATEANRLILSSFTVETGIYYTRLELKTTSSLVGLSGYAGTILEFHSGNNQYEILSAGQSISAGTYSFRVFSDTRTSAWDTVFVKSFQLFNLTASHGVTATSGTSYDNAVADIEAMLALNGGYIDTTVTTHTENVELQSQDGDDNITGVQKFNHGALRSTIDKTVRDKIRYDNGQYVLDRYVDEDSEALAEPILAQSVVDVDGTLGQHDVTTITQLQDIPTTYDIEFSMNTEQSVKTLVQRDKLQQQEIDNNEQRLDTVEPKVTTLEGEMDTVQGEIIALDERVDTAEDDIIALETLTQALQGAYVFRGEIAQSTVDIQANLTLLTNRIVTLLSRNPQLGDVLIDTNDNEWYYSSSTYIDDTYWNNLGQAVIHRASSSVEGIVRVNYTSSGENIKVNIDGSGDIYVTLSRTALNAIIGDVNGRATTSLDGLMSSTDKTRLDNVNGFTNLGSAITSNGTITTGSLSAYSELWIRLSGKETSESAVNHTFLPIPTFYIANGQTYVISLDYGLKATIVMGSGVTSFTVTFSGTTNTQVCQAYGKI